jgi:glutamate-1-semialdehyde 2,1-aminomutase
MLKSVSSSAEYAARARSVIAGGVNSGQRRIPGLEDLVIVSTSGATITDADGRTLIDFHGAYGPTILGHNDPDVDRAVSETMSTIDHVGVGVSLPEIDLAELIVHHVPSVERVFLTSSGSEATYHALRLSRAVTGRTKIAKFQGCYHGWHDSVVLNVITPAERLGELDPHSAGSMTAVTEATVVLPFNDPDAVDRALADRDVAAVILEPIPHAIGVLLPEQTFLERLREACTRTGTVLIFDEIVTGFRHSLGGYQSLVGVTPDLTTVGKAIANGYPIAALGGRADLMEHLGTVPGGDVFATGTFNGHPAMASAGVATIRKLESEPVLEHVFGLGERLRSGLEELYARLGQTATVTGYGSISVAYFMEGPIVRFDDMLRNDAGLFVDYRLRLLDRGFLELPINLKRNTLSYAHTADHIDGLLAATETAVLEARGAR